MRIIIDGYNMLKSILEIREISEHERSIFLAQLSRYARRKAHKIIVVFDGGPYQWTHKEMHGGIQVIYSGMHESADEYIHEYLIDHQTKDVLLVTTDHELRLMASALGITSITAQDFHQLVQEALRPTVKPEVQAGQLVKLTDQENKELDALMAEATVVVPIKEEDVAVRAHRLYKKGKKISKHERLLLQKLNKL
jgi:predicted RNA-binding protein with PIN domain